jgi:OOP family OmpA-OmpF porin
MPDLIQTVTSALPPDAVAKIAGLLGATPSATGTAVGAAAPALLAGAIQQGSTTSGATDLLGLIKQATATGNPVDGIGSILSDDTARSQYLSQGQTLASGLLGARSEAVASAVGGTSGLAAGATSTLLAVLAPLVLGALGKAAGPSPTPGQLQAVLNESRGGVFGALPSGLTSLFGQGATATAGVAGATATAGVAGATATGAAATATAARGGLSRLLPWIIAAIIAVLLLLLLFQCMNKKAPTVTAPALPVVQAPTLPSIPTVNLKLPGGVSINVPEGSIGFGVTKFLESNEPAPKTFVFDNLNFDTAANTLTSESRPTVVTLVTILKAYPHAQARIVGYTDNQGDPAANKTLSDTRAATVKQELVNGGIAADRIETAGLGEENPVADNASEDGRAKNRRTELVIITK